MLIKLKKIEIHMNKEVYLNKYEISIKYLISKCDMRSIYKSRQKDETKYAKTKRPKSVGIQYV